MGLLKKKCEYCRKKIEKDSEIKKDVKILGFVGTRPKSFCCSEHAEGYEKDVEEHMKKNKNGGGGCCH